LISEESKSNTDDQGSFQEAFMKQFQNYLTPLLVMGLFLSSLSFGPREQQQLSLTSKVLQGPIVILICLCAGSWFELRSHCYFYFNFLMCGELV
jgi:hypothetical protein